MSRTLPRLLPRPVPRPLSRAAVAAAAVALAAGLAACGSSGSEADAGASDAAGASPSASDDAGASGGAGDAAEPGDDLLQRPRVGLVFKGSGTNASWRFPEAYETPEGPQKAVLSQDGVGYLIATGYKADATAQEAVAALEQEAATTEGAGDLEVGEETVAGTTFSTAVLSDEDSSLRAYYVTPEGGSDSYQLIFQASQPLDEVPAERLEEFQQFLGSFELEPIEG